MFVCIPYVSFLNKYVYTKSYDFIATDEKSVAYKHCNDIVSLQLVLLRAKKGFPRFISYPNFINDLTNLVSSQTLTHVQLRVCLKY